MISRKDAKAQRVFESELLIESQRSGIAAALIELVGAIIRKDG